MKKTSLILSAALSVLTIGQSFATGTGLLTPSAANMQTPKQQPNPQNSIFSDTAKKSKRIFVSPQCYMSHKQLKRSKGRPSYFGENFEPPLNEKRLSIQDLKMYENQPQVFAAQSPRKAQMAKQVVSLEESPLALTKSASSSTPATRHLTIQEIIKQTTKQGE